MTKIAMCACGEPLVMTFHFYKKEFVCVRCGRIYEYFGPTPADETPKRVERMEENKKLWNEIVEGYLVIGARRLDDCILCKRGDDYSHRDHASKEELEKHTEAEKRLVEWKESLTV